VQGVVRISHSRDVVRPGLPLHAKPRLLLAIDGALLASCLEGGCRPYMDGVTSAGCALVQTSRRDGPCTTCRNRRVIGMLERVCCCLNGRILREAGAASRRHDRLVPFVLFHLERIGLEGPLSHGFLRRWGSMCWRSNCWRRGLAAEGIRCESGKVGSATISRIAQSDVLLGLVCPAGALQIGKK